MEAMDLGNRSNSTYGREAPEAHKDVGPGAYVVDREDLLDQHVGYYLRRHPEVRTRHSLSRKGPGVYELDGREVTIEWQYASEPGGQGFLVVVDGPLRQPFSDYMEETEANAEYEGQDIGTSSLHLIPKERRISFNDQHKVYSRLEAMKVAKEQALVREKAAGYVKDGREVPQDIMVKYKKTIQQKLGLPRRPQSPKQKQNPDMSHMPPGPPRDAPLDQQAHGPVVAREPAGINPAAAAPPALQHQQQHHQQQTWPSNTPPPAPPPPPPVTAGAPGATSSYIPPATMPGAASHPTGSSNVTSHRGGGTSGMPPGTNGGQPANSGQCAQNSQMPWRSSTPMRNRHAPGTGPLPPPPPPAGHPWPQHNAAMTPAGPMTPSQQYAF